MSRIFSFCIRTALIVIVAAIAWSQADQDNAPGLNVKRDSAGQIAVKQSPSQVPSVATEQTGTATQTLEPTKGQYGPVEVLSDTHGVDVGPYVREEILPAVRDHWYAALPQSEQMKKGKVAIQFAIRTDGKVASMKLVSPSGERALDRAAWAGVTGSDPFPPFPQAFVGNLLVLRFNFVYNPDKAELAMADVAAPARAPTFLHARVMTQDPNSRLPRYPKQALKRKTEGAVRVNVEVGADGRVKDVKLLEGDPLLADSAVHAVRKWRFYAAEKDSRPLEEWATIRFDFILNIDQVRARIESYSETSPSR